MTDTNDFPWGIRPADHFQVGDYVVAGADSGHYSSGDIVRVTAIDPAGRACAGSGYWFVRSPLRVLTTDEVEKLPIGAVVRHIRDFFKRKSGDLITADLAWSSSHLTYALVSLPPLPEPEPELVTVTGTMSPASLVQSIEKDLACLKWLLEFGTKKEAPRG